ncbi:MAG: 4-hydroxy-tetrahydrodipicolinate reductase [Zetaproteobacteria bacterium CG06_land_8_20_14_3_00_59_53]|nr:MAG: 4-hydroxy-tetrahydrodipicolinate reductase [Zetaproteobacteria bacterium CG2_30_59_37]PIO90923.1 MAG: 4-hydroxy-tetrahydrodipicolinate reductase [Zetaproteobacteria bacterium CG23_combo_of_CG06-09_8_20_14_all_59_86]PIQ64107.1 MAG: 4-hydroxy-tetrahydrodipicolinate reductase [Zetaproteobacteria bacterium CG11_big_fil_rev_8_21_14_0_20_59_439]PIU71105.1 MAG: 4-hydroxy-tetrahydrodipicolinate reductase [Zetaproteobacteria bacterium CG06_land_8_20_14_3_00_59_53]PIU96098.1 MAG: 4-hydroxy-tetrah
MMRVIISGASGRMGRMLVQAVSEMEGAELVGATERAGSEWLGRDAGELAGIGTLGIKLVDGLSGLPQADVLIDFTAAAASLEHARYAAANGVAMVIGTTGHTAEQLSELKRILGNTPVVMAANYSVGVNLALILIEQAAAVLDAGYDAEIFEAHHRHKVDAPSGTALAMGRSLAAGRDVKLEDVAVYAREGITGARKEGDIGFSVMRAGAIVGEHKAMFVSDAERIEINHIATDRMVFARGAVRAAAWLNGQEAGWYGMREVLGLK